jgi:hypothetical protein
MIIIRTKSITDYQKLRSRKVNWKTYDYKMHPGSRYVRGHSVGKPRGFRGRFIKRGEEGKIVDDYLQGG